MTDMNVVGTVATTVSKQGEYMVCTYHQTAVVKWNEDEIILNTGGWRTNTTKTRMNQVSNQYGLGFSVWQEDGEWYVMWDRNNTKLTQTLLYDQVVYKRR